MHTIAYDSSYPIAAHLSCSVSDYAMLVVEQNRETAIGKDFIYLSFERKQFFFRQGLSFRCTNISRNEKGSM